MLQPIDVNVQSDIIELEQGQITQKLHKSTWDQLRFRTQKIASNVALQIMVPGKDLIKSSGPLYLYETTYLFVELNNTGQVSHALEINTVGGNELKIDDQTGQKQELHKAGANYKIDRYIQKQVNTNELIVFEMMLPLYQDITRYCSRMNQSKVRQSNWSPFLILMLAYSIILNLVFAGPSFGLFVDLGQPIPLILNASFITSIFWFAYLEHVRVAYWATMKVESSHKLSLLFEVKYDSPFTGKNEIKKIRRMFDVFYLKVYFSHVAYGEAFRNQNNKLIETELVIKYKSQYDDVLFKNQKLEVQNKDLIQKNNILSQTLEETERKTREVAAEYWLKGYQLRNSSKFQPISKIMNTEAIFKYLIYGFVILASIIVFGYIIMPVLNDMLGQILNFKFGSLDPTTKIMIFGIEIILFMASLIFIIIALRGFLVGK